MMKKLITVLFLSVMGICKLHSQYYKWAHELPFQQNGRQVSNMTVDTSGNVYTLGVNQTCLGCTELFVRKEDKNGNFQFEFTALPVAGTISVSDLAIDNTGNIFVSAVKTSGYIVIGGNIINSSDFIFKLNSSGNVMWALQNESGHLATDTSGAVYITNGTYTKKHSSDGTMKWQYVSLKNATGIGVDKYRRCFVTNADSIIKINKTGKKILYAKNFGGNFMRVDKTGNVFLLTASSLKKLNPSGSVTWTLNSGGIALAIDKNNAAYLVTNNATLQKVSASGLLTAWTMTGVNTPFTNVGVDNSKNVYVSGNYNPSYLAILCPFKLADKNGGSIANAQSFTASLFNSGSYPFQAGIFTGDFYPTNGNSICKNQVFQVPFSYSLNRLSSFGPANEFRAQASDDDFQTFTDIGRADSAVISSSWYNKVRIRVVSTDPPVNGYPNYCINANPGITVIENNASISAGGPTSFCSGNSVQLIAALQSYTNRVDWYRGDTFLGNDTMIIATESGDYRAIFQNGNCETTSNVITVTAYPKIPVIITPNGPTTFCAGGSVLLVANPSTGLSYQWRKNGINIPGATSSDFLATEPGKYSVKTTNSYGCLKISYAITVSVPCRVGDEDEQQTLSIYPNPFSSTITVSGYENITGLSLRNILGQVVFEKKSGSFRNPEQLDLSMLRNGVYFMEIHSSTGSKLLKVIKQK